MLEYYQGVNVSAVSFPGRETVTILVPGNVYEVDDSMGQWLLENRKAILLAEMNLDLQSDNPVARPEAKPKRRSKKE